MTTYAPPARTHRPHVKPWLLALIIVLAGLVGVGVWQLVERGGPAEEATPAVDGTGGARAVIPELASTPWSPRGAASVIDELTAAWSAGDIAAAETLYAGATIVTASGHRYYFWGGLLSPKAGPRPSGYLVGRPEATAGVRAKRIAPVTVSGNFAATFLRYTTADGKEGTLLTVVQLAPAVGAGLIGQWDFELGVTPPFDHP